MAGIPRYGPFDFLFNLIGGVGRGIYKNQIDWSVDDPEFDALLSTMGAAGLNEAQAMALIKEFARTGSTTPPLASDIALDPHDDYQPNTTYEIGQNIAGGVRRPQWVPRPPSTASFFISLTTRPTPAQIAPGGLVAGGGHVLVTPDDGPEEIWARYLVVSDLVKVATFADHIIRPDAMGRLPAATDNIGRVGLAGNRFYYSVGEQGTDKVVTFKDYDPARVVETGEPAKSNDELLFAGSFADPPIGNYTLNAWAWDRGSEVWIRNLVHNGASWVSSVGPPAYHHGNLYQTESDAAVHVPNATYAGRIYIIGHGANQKPKIVTGYTAPTAPSAEWIPIGLTIQQVDEQVGAHNASSTAHTDIRTLISNLSAAGGLVIGAYSATATYIRGSANSFVTHGSDLLVYISGTERSQNHEPAEHPNYWHSFTNGANVRVIDGSTNTRFYIGNLLVTHEDEVYLCVTNAQASTNRNLQYVKANSGIGGEFVNLTNLIPTVWRGAHIFGQAYKAGEEVYTGVLSGSHRIWVANRDTSTTPTLNNANPDWYLLAGPESVHDRGTYSESGQYYRPGDISKVGAALYFFTGGTGYLAEANDGEGPTDVGQTNWTHMNPAAGTPVAAASPVHIIEDVAWESSPIVVTLEDWRNYTWMKVAYSPASGADDAWGSAAVLIDSLIFLTADGLEVPLKQNDAITLNPVAAGTPTEDNISIGAKGFPSGRPGVGDKINIWLVP